GGGALTEPFLAAASARAAVEHGVARLAHRRTSVRGLLVRGRGGGLRRGGPAASGWAATRHAPATRSAAVRVRGSGRLAVPDMRDDHGVRPYHPRPVAAGGPRPGGRSATGARDARRGGRGALRNDHRATA